MSADLVGKTIGGCRLERVLGRGGMSTTFLAQHLTLELPVVVKTLDPARAWGRPGLVEAFLREGRALGSVLHPNVVRVLSAGTEGQVPYLVLEYAQGVSLRARLREEELEHADAVRVVGEAARGLGAAHAQGIVHGDVKPENMLHTGDGQLKVSDFGLARWTGEPLAGKSGAIHGTPAYMSPEHCRGEPLDPRSDIYSLGVVLFECLVDRWPFNAPEPRLLLEKHLDEAPPVGDLREAGLPSALVAIVARCLEKDPAARPANGGELAEALGAVRFDAQKPRRQKRRRASSSATHRSLGARGSASSPARSGSSGLVVVVVLTLAAAVLAALVLAR